MKKRANSPNDKLTRVGSVFFATFSHYEGGRRMPRNGMVDPILSFFLPKINKLLLIDQPHQISDTINPIIEIYSKHKLRRRFKISPLFYLPVYLFCLIPGKKQTRVSYKLRDLFSVIFIGLMQREKYDLFVGLEGINVLGGLFLKKIGKIKTVVYYVSDYSPTRFGETLFNKLYLWLDRFCVKHADFTWDVSSAMKEGRIEGGLSVADTGRILHVPNGLFSSQINSLPIKKRISNRLVYLGSLDYEFGVDLAIKSLKRIKKNIPGATLHIIGGGEEENFLRLKALVKKLDIEDSVIFHGFVIDNNKMAEMVSSSYIGVAPYRSGDSSARWYGWYGDAGKIRQYLASGLPVVTTHVPPLGRFAAEKGAAVMKKDTVRDFSEGILTLLLDKKKYKELSQKAQELGKNNTWENSYNKALQKMKMSLTRFCANTLYPLQSPIDEDTSSSSIG